MQSGNVQLSIDKLAHFLSDFKGHNINMDLLWESSQDVYKQTSSIHFMARLSAASESHGLVRKWKRSSAKLKAFVLIIIPQCGIIIEKMMDISLVTDEIRYTKKTTFYSTNTNKVLPTYHNNFNLPNQRCVLIDNSLTTYSIFSWHATAAQCESETKW